MLVLSRKEGESITLKTKEGDIRVTYVEQMRGRAKLAFDAPMSVNIVRDELIKKDDNFGNR